MKRILSTILAISLMVSLLAGCTSPNAVSSSTKPADPGTATSTEGEALTGKLRLWTHQNAAWTEGYQKQIDKFVAMHPGVTIEQESFPYTDFQSKLQTSLVSGDGADIYVIFGSWAADYMPTGALSKVPDSLAATITSDYYPSAKGGFTYNDAYYGLPLEFNIEYGGLIVNKKLFDQKQLTYPTTWAELEAVADATGVRKGEIMEMRGFEYAGGDGLANLFLAMILQKGGRYLNEDGKTVDFTTPQAIDAMTNLVSYAKDRSWTNTDGDSTGGAFMSVFRDEAMMTMVGPWGVSLGSGSFGLTYGTDYEYIQLPQYGDKNAFAAETGWGMVVPEKSKNKDVAWKFIEWLSQPENLLEHNINCSQIPPCKTVATDPKYLEALPYTKPILDILDGGQHIGSFNTDLFKQTLSGVFGDLVRTDKYASIADGLLEVQNQINALSTK